MRTVNTLSTERCRGWRQWVGAIALLVPLPVFAQDPLPEGSGRDAMAVICSQCHPLTRIFDSDMDAAEWETLLYDMIARGAPVYERDIELLQTYLAENFARERE